MVIRMKKKIYPILIVLWMCFIFYMSAQPATVSSAQSGGFISFLSPIPFVGDIVSYLMDIKIGEFIIRKSAHMFLFFVLAILIYLYKYNKVNILKTCAIAFLLTFLYACTDEFHQLFVLGRSGEIRDVMVDSTGAFIGVIVAGCISKLIIFSNKKKKDDTELKKESVDNHNELIKNNDISDSKI